MARAQQISVLVTLVAQILDSELMLAISGRHSVCFSCNSGRVRRYWGGYEWKKFDVAP